MDQGKIREFTDLDSWKQNHNLVLLIYRINKKFPESERFGLISQMERAAVSVTSNIAEGFGRQTMKEKVHFYYQAHGSLTELKNQLIIARDLGYTRDISFMEIMDQLITGQKLLRGLTTKSKSFIKS